MLKQVGNCVQLRPTYLLSSGKGVHHLLFSAGSRLWDPGKVLSFDINLYPAGYKILIMHPAAPENRNLSRFPVCAVRELDIGFCNARRGGLLHRIILFFQILKCYRFHFFFFLLLRLRSFSPSYSASSKGSVPRTFSPSFLCTSSAFIIVSLNR